MTKKESLDFKNLFWQYLLIIYLSQAFCFLIFVSYKSRLLSLEFLSAVCQTVNKSVYQINDNSCYRNFIRRISVKISLTYIPQNRNFHTKIFPNSAIFFSMYHFSSIVWSFSFIPSLYDNFFSTDNVKTMLWVRVLFCDFRPKPYNVCFLSIFINKINRFFFLAVFSLLLFFLSSIFSMINDLITCIVEKCVMYNRFHQAFAFFAC